MSDFISREAAKKKIDFLLMPSVIGKTVINEIDAIPAADVLPRDEAIKMGAELAAMHGSDAASQQLEEAYLKGVEYGMTRRDVQPVKRGKWMTGNDNPRSYGRIRAMCGRCGAFALYEMVNVGSFKEQLSHFCPNCGADLRPEIAEETNNGRKSE